MFHPDFRSREPGGVREAPPLGDAPTPANGEQSVGAKFPGAAQPQQEEAEQGVEKHVPMQVANQRGMA